MTHPAMAANHHPARQASRHSFTFTHSQTSGSSSQDASNPATQPSNMGGDAPHASGSSCSPLCTHPSQYSSPPPRHAHYRRTLHSYFLALIHGGSTILPPNLFPSAAFSCRAFLQSRKNNVEQYFSTDSATFPFHRHFSLGIELNENQCQSVTSHLSQSIHKNARK